MPTTRRAGGTVRIAAGLTVVFLVVSTALLLVPEHSVPAAPSTTLAPGTGAAPGLSAASNNTGPTPQCDGMYWSSIYWARYVPSYCYGHDEPTMSYVSTVIGSGADASWQLVLPNDSSAYPQADFYATFWFGGVVLDPQSTGSQAFLELQLYPSAPFYTGPGSANQDCLPNGAFNPQNWVGGTNEWFACAVVWQLLGGAIEDAAFAGPMAQLGTTAILVYHSGDHLVVNFTGVPDSATQGWHLEITDLTSGLSAATTLQNGTEALPPFYATALPQASLVWGASGPGAVAFAYEIGHTLNTNISSTYTCAPGDHVCDSYWPGRWAQSGQMQLSLPVMGNASLPTGTTSYPSQIDLSSSQGGETEINASLCRAPSTNTSKNCLYPWFIYRSANYSFTFDTSPVPNATHQYGGIYQFPGTQTGVTYNHSSWTAPWGSLNATISPTAAGERVEFNPRHGHRPIPLEGGNRVTGSFMEGPYWLNVTAPACAPASIPTYISPATTTFENVTLNCGPLTNVTFEQHGLPAGATWSVTLNGTTLTSNGSAVEFRLPPSSVGVGYSVTGPRGYAAHPSHGVVVVGQTPIVVNTTFVSTATYAVTFVERGLPLPMNWSIVLNGSVESSTNRSLTMFLPNGTYSYAVQPVPGYVREESGGAVTVNGIGVTIPINFSKAQTVSYAVTFVPQGLPADQLWSVTLNGTTQEGMGALSFEEPNGTYAYRVNPVFGYVAAAPSGNVTVVGSGISTSVVFSSRAPPSYPLTFDEHGLPSGTRWSVTVHFPTLYSVSRNSTTTTLTFLLDNGSYEFSVGAVPSFVSSPPSGLINISGNGVTMTIVFRSNSTTSGPNLSSGGLLGLPGTDGYYVVGGLVAVVGATGGLLLHRRRRRHSTSGPGSAERSGGSK